MSLLSALKTLHQENVVSVKELQKSPSRSLHGMTRILRGKKPLGIFISQELLEDFIEDMEALSSKKYLASIRAARREVTKSKTHSLTDIMRRYGI